MIRRTLAVVGAVALAIATPTAALAASPGDDPSSKYQKSETARGPVGTTTRPMSVGSDGRVTVVVEMKGDPVAVVEAKKGSDLTTAERNSVKSTLKQAQDAIAGSIKNKGGKIQANMQSAYNGIQVSIPADQVDAVAALPNVVAVHAVKTYTLDNAVSVPFLGVPAVWQNTGYTGKNVKVAVIDTGIDYTHANFGGAGTPAAYEAANAAETQPADPAQFGPAAPRVKGGYDFVGDAYNADPSSPTYQPVPKPDPNPLDCNGHGSHVAGTAAGSGVANGATYPGPYNASTPSKTFDIGPGVAPQADLYALRVFGCDGSTDVIVPGHRLGSRPRHGRHQHVARFALRPRRRPRRGGRVQRHRRRRRRGQVRGQRRPEPVPRRQRRRRDLGRRSRQHRELPGRDRSPSDGVAIPAINANGADLSAVPGTTVVRLTDDPATPTRTKPSGARSPPTRTRESWPGATSSPSRRAVCAPVSQRRSSPSRPAPRQPSWSTRRTTTRRSRARSRRTPTRRGVHRHDPVPRRPQLGRSEARGRRACHDRSGDPREPGLPRVRVVQLERSSQR